jgi:plastocyanin
MLKMPQTLLQLQKRVALLLVVLMAVIGCSDTATEPIQMNLADQLWDVRIEPRAITMSTVAPYDTITLRTIAWNGVGDTITEGLQIRYHSVTDTTVRISDDGVLKVRAPTNANGIKIVASVTYNNVTQTDTALVVVTTQPTPPHTLDAIVLEAIDPSLRTQRAPIWSLNTGFDTNPILAPRVLSNESTVANVPIAYVSSNQAIAIIDPWTGQIYPKLEGTARIVATTTWYGTTYQTTLDIMVVGATFGDITIEERIPRGSDTTVTIFNPQTLVVEVGATIRWTNQTSQSVDIIFEDPTNVHQITTPTAEYFQLICLVVGQGCNVGQSGGNMLLLVFDPAASDAFGNMDMRYFPVQGTYHYRTTSGATGTITVKSSITENAVQ